MNNKQLGRIFQLQQETLYWNSRFLNKKWYRRIFGGKWFLIKLGKDTPYTWMFIVWTKAPNGYAGYKEIVKWEDYPETGVNTRWKFWRQLFKQIFNIK